MTLLSLVAVGSSLLVVTAPNTVISILWLVVVFVTTSLLLGLLGLGYAALLYVIVYVGAIAIIFLFVVQLLGSHTNFSQINNWARFLPFASGHLPQFQDSTQNQGGEKTGYFDSSRQSTALGSTTLPIATLISLSIIYIIAQFSAGMTHWQGQAGQLNGSFAYVVSSMYEWLPTFFSAEGAATESFLSKLPYDLVQQENSNSILSFNVSGSSQVYNLAEWLYGGATLPLIIASIILLLAMIAPIVLCRVKVPSLI